MQQLINDCKEKVETELASIENETSELLKKAEKSIECIVGCLEQMREIIHQNGFDTKEAEILFFKKTKPELLHRIIFFRKLVKIESEKPVANRKARKKYIKSQVKKIRRFYKENREFCRYMRSGMTHFDSAYFTRENFNINLLDTSDFFDIDSYFSTGYDYKASCLLAYDRISEYLDKELFDIDCSSSSLWKNEIPKIAWTDSKVGLIELIYALHSTGCFNNGNADIKEIAHYFSNVFSIDLGDYYRNYLEIKSRNEPTKLLEELQRNLQRRIEEQDNR